MSNREAAKPGKYPLVRVDSTGQCNGLTAAPSLHILLSYSKHGKAHAN